MMTPSPCTTAPSVMISASVRLVTLQITYFPRMRDVAILSSSMGRAPLRLSPARPGTYGRIHGHGLQPQLCTRLFMSYGALQIRPRGGIAGRPCASITVDERLSHAVRYPA